MLSAKQMDVGSSLTLNQFFCACNFGFVRLFFASFFNVSKGYPFKFFDNFATEWTFKKSQRVPPFSFFGTLRLTGDFKKIQKNSVIFFLIFFHCFDIVRLLLDKTNSAKVAPSFCQELCGRMDVENTKRSRLSVFFGIVRRFFNFVFHQRVSPSFF